MRDIGTSSGGVAGSPRSEEPNQTDGAGILAQYAGEHACGADPNEVGDPIPLAQAQANPVPIDWAHYRPPTLAEPGIQVLDAIPLEEVSAHIDWTWLFHAWQLAGPFPQILNDPRTGKEARRLHDDALAMLYSIVTEGWLTARAVIGLFPASSVGDDILVYADAGRTDTRGIFHFLRKQMRQPEGRPNECLADFVAPAHSGLPDSIGAFACSAGLGIDAQVERFEADRDPYSALMLKALADRLTEALVEMLHLRVRTRHWRCAAEEGLSEAVPIEGPCQGIRAVLGCPACPDPTEKDLLWRLLEVERHTGIRLTEPKATVPTAAVAGLYFAHPESRCFAVGRIGRDQVADYAERKGMTVAEVQRWLRPNLAYAAES